VGDLGDVAPEDVGQLEQDCRRHGTLVVLDLADIAQRQAETTGERSLRPATALPKAPHTRPHEELAGSRHFTRFRKIRSSLRTGTQLFLSTSVACCAL